MTQEQILKPDRSRGGTHLEKQSQNSLTSVCWSDCGLDTFAIDV